MAPAIAERVNTYVLLEEPRRTRRANTAVPAQHIGNELARYDKAEPAEVIAETLAEFGLSLDAKSITMAAARIEALTTGPQHKDLQSASKEVLVCVIGSAHVEVAGYIPGETIRIGDELYEVTEQVDDLTDLQIAEPVMPFSHR